MNRGKIADVEEAIGIAVPTPIYMQIGICVVTINHKCVSATAIVAALSGEEHRETVVEFVFNQG